MSQGAADILKGNGSNDALPNETPEKVDENTPSLTFHQNASISTHSQRIPALTASTRRAACSRSLRKKPPTLREALLSMGYDEKTEEFLRMFTDKTKERLEEIEAPGLSVEDVAVIFCYTYEGGVDNPYRKLNQSISVERSNPALRKTRAFLFLLLRALRKLPRYISENKTLYMG